MFSQRGAAFGVYLVVDVLPGIRDSLWDGFCPQLIRGRDKKFERYSGRRLWAGCYNSR